MDESIIYSDEYVKITSADDTIYIESLKKGFQFEQLNSIISGHPEIGITNFTVLKTAIEKAPQPSQKFGILKDRIELRISDDELKAVMILNVRKEDLEYAGRERLYSEVHEKLKEKNIIYGINDSILKGELSSGKQYVIAEGTPPVNGKDSIIKMLEFKSLKELKPEIHEKGKANFYELNLINRVKKGDWLGERIEATSGVPGTTVTGKVIEASDGKTLPLNYDADSVIEFAEGNKTVLYSKINGAVNYTGNRITVSNHLEIDGDVDFRTGNIKFDGYVTIKGTVADGFSVEATRDIEINSGLGIGNVKLIESKYGSIFIKGGIASNGKADIRAGKNVYTKFADNATIISGGLVHIGFSSINSNITAKEVKVDSSKGQIIGGSIKAQIRVSAPVMGSDFGKKTYIEITGFNRNALLQKLTDAANRLEELKKEQQQLKLALQGFGSFKNLSTAQRQEYEKIYEKIAAGKEEAKSLEETKKDLVWYLRAHGEGEICVTKKAYHNCFFTINGIVHVINTETLASTFYTQDGEVKQI